MIYQWKKIKRGTRSVWQIVALSLLVIVNACAPKQTIDSRSYMETQAEFYTLHGVDIDPREECLDTDDLTVAEIREFAKTNGCAEYFVELGIKF